MFKSNLITGLLGIVCVGTFMGIVVGWVKAAPLIVIVLIVGAMMLYDFWREMRRIRDSRS